ncbi:MAG: LytR/AlgR family response regulator transcription factor [Sporomusa sp.]
MLRAIVVDDEAPARDELKFLLAQEQGLTVVNEADSGSSAIQVALEANPDVIFIDVQMRGMNGLEAATALRAVIPHALIVFATAYDEHAVQAFEIGAVDYLLKPFDQQRIHTTVERLKHYRSDEWQAAGHKIDAALKLGKVQLNKLPVEKSSKIIMLNYHDILYVRAHDSAAVVVTGHDKYHYGGTLSEMQERLQGTTFMRIHKSYIVNMDKVKEVIPWFKGTYWLKVEGRPEVEIPVSKNHIKEIKDMLGLR